MKKSFISANIQLFKVNNRNTRKRCEICSKLTIKTPELRQSCRSDVVNFDLRQVTVNWDVTVNFVDIEKRYIDFNCVRVIKTKFLLFVKFEQFFVDKRAIKTCSKW